MKEKIIYFDENDKEVDSVDKAKKFVILKEGPNGERTERWGIVPDPDYDWRTVITQEQYDLLVSKGIEVDDKRYKVVEKQDNSKKY